MTKQIVSEMEWDKAELSELPVENGFRMRGLETTRLDTFVDAGFAFVLSFLAISQDALPSSFSELLVGVKAVPALVLSFLILMLFWLEHRRWSRRYGIETKSSVLVSVSLVFVLLIFIFQLRLLFESMFDFLTDGFLPFNFIIKTEEEYRAFFALYAIGFLVMSLLITALYGTAIKKHNSLLLNKREYQDTKNILIRWSIAAFFAITSLILTYTLPVQQLHWAGFVLFGMFLVQFVHRLIVSRKKYR